MAMSVAEAVAALQALQPVFNAAADECWHHGAGLHDKDPAAPVIAFPDLSHSRIWVANLGGGLAVEYRGSEYRGWPEFLETLGRPGIAEHIVELRIAGPDEGANGIKEWNFAELIAAKPDFSKLAEFHVGQTDPGDHNQSMIADDQLPSLIAYMPALRTLELPQAPECGFFDLNLPFLTYLRTGSHWQTRGFIRHLADATRLPALSAVDFGDSLAPWFSLTPQDDPAWESTPFADYERLFSSAVIDRIAALRLRNTRLTEVQYRALQAMHPKCQLSVILAPPHCYVSHWGTTSFPYRHLLPFG